MDIQICNNHAVLNAEADFDSLSSVHDFIDCFLSKVQIEESTIFNIKLSTIEIVTNIIKYAYADQKPGDFRIEIDFYNGNVEVAITDYGTPIPDAILHNIENRLFPVSPMPDDPQTWMEGGMGLIFVSQVMDDFSYISDCFNNVFTIIKHVD
jgi:serine/threonine-protein kinase RsbW